MFALGLASTPFKERKVLKNKIKKIIGPCTQHHYTHCNKDKD
jgi:hypothetical protein